MPHFLGHFKQLKGEVKIKSDDINNELTKEIEKRNIKLNKNNKLYDD